VTGWNSRVLHLSIPLDLQRDCTNSHAVEGSWFTNLVTFILILSASSRRRIETMALTFLLQPVFMVTNREGAGDSFAFSTLLRKSSFRDLIYHSFPWLTLQVFDTVHTRIAGEKIPTEASATPSLDD
jgi:hypothetical protein